MPTFAIGDPAPSGSDPWVSGESLASDKRLDDVDLPPEVGYDACAQSATDFLYRRSGRRFRIHNLVVRPNRQGVQCWCEDGLTELDLPSPVVADSVVITIDGVALDSSAYRLYSGHLLVRTDGSVWPVCAHLGAPYGTDWSIAFSTGQPPPMDGILACRELAIHVALALSGKQSKIPARATTLSRGGLSINLLRGNKTGIALVDDFLSSSNPENLTGRPSAMSPDTIRLSRT